MHFRAWLVGLLARGEVSNRLGLAILVNLEIVSLQFRDQLTLFVDDGDTHVDEVYGGAKHRDLPGCRICQYGHDGSEGPDQATTAAVHHAALYTRHTPL